MEQAIANIRQDLDSLQQQEISTKLIGDKVIEQLRLIDPIAYVRYASVYRCFEEVGEFIEEIQSLKRHTPNASQAPLNQ